jgi:carbonic anhydrase
MQQSPININTCTQKTRTGHQLKKKWKTLDSLSAYNNGHGITVEAPFGQTIYEYKSYEVEAIKFHMKSEHQIDGHPFLMEMQVLHRAADGSLMNIAKLFELGPNNNKFLQDVHWYELPAKRGDRVSFTTSVSLIEEFPSDDADYWTYSGSLTAPPCTEGTVWVVMSSLGRMSTVQRDQSPYQKNFRPPQALYNRDVFFLSEGEDAFDVKFQYQTQWAGIAAIAPNLVITVTVGCATLASVLTLW